MLLAFSNTTADGAGLAGVSRVDELDPDADGLRLVGDEGLQLRPGPPVQTGAHALAGLYPLADVGELLHGDRAALASDCLRDDCLADLMVDVSDVPGFAAGDFSQQLPCRLGAVALKPLSEGKEPVAVVPEFATTEQLAGACGGQVVLPEIDTHGASARQWVGVR